MTNFQVMQTKSAHKEQKTLVVSENLPYQSMKKSLKDKNVKIILVWGLNYWPSGSMPLNNAGCSVKSCVFTSEVSMINQSDVVVFYIETLTDFPINRHPHQRFVFYQLESPVNNNNDNIRKIYDLRLRYGYFNWTMTYRWDSDIVYRGDYGYIVKKRSKIGNRPYGIFGAISQKDWFPKAPESPKAFQLASIDDHKLNAIIKGKQKLVAWFVSHCSTPIRREEYVRKLSQYISIDIYGSCNNQDCPSSGCDNMLRRNYKFYLAFENSWCPDYVTEKLYRPMIYDTVPIVMGGANYSKFAPANSYINARDFASPKELAKYLLRLDKFDNLYAKYFDWKKNYEIVLPDNNGLCDLCRMAHDETLPSQSYFDMEQWWIHKESCETDSTKYF